LVQEFNIQYQMHLAKVDATSSRKTKGRPPLPPPGYAILPSTIRLTSRKICPTLASTNSHGLQ
jgi:hypothetical protein